jgi:hypothetical protein
MAQTEGAIPGRSELMADMSNFLRDLAVEHDRPLETLFALERSNDPFLADSGYRLRGAHWFADLWRRLNLPFGVHTRRIHYRLVSLPSPIQMCDGRPYENTKICVSVLNVAVRDAIYLGLLPGGAIVDNKNPAPVEFLVEPEPADIHTSAYFDHEFALSDYAGTLELPNLPSLPDLPDLPLAWLASRPKVAQRYHIEIWCEKSTINDVLLPLGSRHGVNIITGTGELSATACRNLVDRAEKSSRAVRILYISDFDPAGLGMPVAIARKIEFELQKRGLELDIQVRPAVLRMPNASS